MAFKEEMPTFEPNLQAQTTAMFMWTCEALEKVAMAHGDGLLTVSDQVDRLRVGTKCKYSV